MRSSSELYRDVVRAHARAPRGAGALALPTARAVANNALCGDRVEVMLRIDGAGRILAIRHVTEGCLLCTASASLMSVHAKGVDRRRAFALCERVAEMIAGGSVVGDRAELRALAGVAAFPSRVGCVLLPWRALADALREG